MVTIKLLGPVSLEVKGRPVAMRSVRMRSLLAAVGLAGGQPVAVRRLVDQLWGVNPPGTALREAHRRTPPVSARRECYRRQYVAHHLIP